jgi:hypothetical protein
MESSICEAPEELYVAGPNSLVLLRQLLETVPVEEQALRARFEALVSSYEASLYAALDFHAPCDLHEHDMQARKIAAVVAAAFADAAAARNCRRSLARVAQLCAVEVSAPPQVPTLQQWSTDLARYLTLRHERQREQNGRGAQ